MAGAALPPKPVYRPGLFGELQAIPNIFLIGGEESPVLFDPKIPLYGKCVDEARPIQGACFLTVVSDKAVKVQKRWEND